MKFSNGKLDVRPIQFHFCNQTHKASGPAYKQGMIEWQLRNEHISCLAFDISISDMYLKDKANKNIK